jgi:UDP-GlcNAc:undecaprenyl-phosphate/decaprenyl-phosphate GlcNAc-1-phosphate transferase
VDSVVAIAIVLVAAGVSASMTPLVINFATKAGAVDQPNDRKVSLRSQMPLWGGLAVATGCLSGLALAFAVLDMPDLLRSLIGFGSGSIVLVATGAWDDRFNLRPTAKLALQFVAAAIAIESGFRVDLFSNFLTEETVVVPWWLMWPVSLLWIVGVTNAMNLIDGLDGLSSGVGAIIAGTLTILCWQAGQWIGVIVGLSLLGSLIGYLPFNFPPARIFLGDTGSLLIGFGLSVLALEGYRKTALLAFVVPLLALAIPLLDTTLSIVRRLRSGRSVFSADRLHMHHRLLQREGSHKNAVLMLYFLTGCFCMIAVSFSQLDGWVAFLYLAAVVGVTIRLLRNLDAFSLEVLGDSPRPSDENDADNSPS